MTVVSTPCDDTTDQDVLITGGGDGTLKIWDLGPLRSSGLILKHKFKIAQRNILSLASSGIFLYAGLSDGSVYVYSLTSMQLIQKLDVPYGDVNTVRIRHGIAFCGTSQAQVKVSRIDRCETIVDGARNSMHDSETLGGPRRKDPRIRNRLPCPL